MDEKVKHNFQKLLEYQKKDIELRKLNDMLNRDEALVSMNKNKRLFNDAKQTISDCEQQAGALLDTYSELQKYVEDNEALLTELEKVESNDDDIEVRVKKLESLKSKFQMADKRLHDVEDKSKCVCAKRADALKSGNAAKHKFTEARDRHNQLVSSKSKELEGLKSELERLRAGLDQSMYTEYTKLVEDNKFPPVVPAAGDEKKNMFNCGGCGLGLPQKGNAMLADQGWCRCENCRRIIVKLN